MVEKLMVAMLIITMMFCGIWYHLNNLKNVKNTHGGVLLLEKLQAFIAQVFISVSIHPG